MAAGSVCGGPRKPWQMRPRSSSIASARRPALGMKPPRFLRAGDAVSLAITRLGTQTQRVVSRSTAAAG